MLMMYIVTVFSFLFVYKITAHGLLILKRVIFIYVTYSEINMTISMNIFVLFTPFSNSHIPIIVDNSKKIVIVKKVIDYSTINTVFPRK